jgi:hypothetical protein
VTAIERLGRIMLDLVIRAVDRLIDLAKIREKRIRIRFEEIYRPSFLELQAVHTDYLKMFTELDCKLEKIRSHFPEDDPVAVEALEFLRMRRTDLLPIRAKLQAFYSFVESIHGLSLPNVERAFLQSLVKYFAVVEPTADRYATHSTALVNRLERTLRRRVQSGQLENQKPSKFSYPTISGVRAQCRESIATLEQGWETSVVCFNDLRILYTIHSS